MKETAEQFAQKQKKRACETHHREAIEASLSIRDYIENQMAQLGECGLITEFSFTFKACKCLRK